MDLKTKYKVKGIGKEQTISSKVNIYVDEKTGLIVKVEDKWNDKLPDDSGIANVSLFWRLEHEAEKWGWWLWSFVWYTTPWMVGSALGVAGIRVLGIVLTCGVRVILGFSTIECRYGAAYCERAEK